MNKELRSMLNNISTEQATLLTSIIRTTVGETIDMLVASGYLRLPESETYKVASDMLKSYYAAIDSGDKPDPLITEALNAFHTDDYFQIIPMYYQDLETNEGIAAAYNCDVSTITRNKRRLCLLIHNYIVVEQARKRGI